MEWGSDGENQRYPASLHISAKPVNQLWLAMSYGAYSSEYLKVLESEAIWRNPHEAMTYLWRMTSFEWETCRIWVQWLQSIYIDLPIAEVKLTQ